MLGRFLDRFFRIDKLSDHPPAGSPEADWHAKEHNQELSRLVPQHAESIRDSDMLSKKMYDHMDGQLGILRDAQTTLAERKAKHSK